MNMNHHAAAILLRWVMVGMDQTQDNVFRYKVPR